MKILLLIVVGGVLYVLYKLKRHHDRYKHIPGLSLLDVFKNAKDMPGRTAKYTREKLARIDLPGTTMVLATHPDSAKVNPKLFLCSAVINYLIVFSLCYPSQRSSQSLVLMQ